MLSKAPLLEGILNYKKENNLILSMPGNKSGKGFLKDSLGKEFLESMGRLDITEVEPLDNLHSPEGIIKEAIGLAKNYYGAKKCYFTVNGSSSGNLISIFSAFNEGDEVLVERNCHKSIYNGLILRKIKVSYIEGNIDDRYDIFMPPTRKDILNAASNIKNLKGIILTYPNYFGIGYHIEDTLIELKKRGIKIVLDCAHGAHFNASRLLPKELTSIGDYVVLSAHKTIPALTQGGYLLVNDNENRSDFYFSAFTTTSPSYLIMASLDYARYYLQEFGESDYGRLIGLSEKWKIKINHLKKVKILSTEDLAEEYFLDRSRYVLILERGYSGEGLLKHFRKNKIQCEMSFKRGVVLILSSMQGEEDFEKIYMALKNLNLESIKEKSLKSRFIKKLPEKKFEPYEVFNSEGLDIDIKKAEGKIARESIVPYPPGIPIICQGEVITEEIINILNEYMENGYDVLGIHNGKIKVIK